MAPACGPSTVSSRRRTAFPLYCVDAPRPGWWNGRHDGLKNRCRKVCGFKSRPGHHEPQTAPFGEPFFVGSELADGAVFRCRPRPSPPRLNHRLHSLVSLFRNSAQQTPRDRHRAHLSLPGRDRDAGVARVFPGGESTKGRCAIVSAGGASISRSLLRRIGPFGNKTREGKGHLLPEHGPAPPVTFRAKAERPAATGRQAGGHFAPRLRAARDGTSPPASANPCVSQSAREATPESASLSSRIPCPSSSRTHTHSRTAPTSR